MRFFIKFSSVIMSIVLVFCSITVVKAEQAKTVSAEYLEDINEPLDEESATVINPEDLQITSKSAILIEQTTGRILYELNSHERLSPASVTKIMSLLLIMEAIDNKQLDLDQQITASDHASSMGGSQIWLEEGEAMSVDHLLKATVIASANDATVALAEAVAGSEEAFVSLMNQKAKALGMSDTEFKNCTGLDAEGHLTSAHDIAIMSAELLNKHPLIMQYTTVWMDTIRDGTSELVNTNKLVRFYEGTTGLKTGTTSNAGYCLSASATREGLSLIAVVMDSPSSKQRFNEARTLLSHGFANYTITSVELPKEIFSPIAVKSGTQSSVAIEAPTEIKVLVKKSEAQNIKVETEIKTSLQAPVAKGTQVGICRIMGDGGEIATAAVHTAESVPKMTFLYAFLRILRQMAVI